MCIHANLEAPKISQHFVKFLSLINYFATGDLDKTLYQNRNRIIELYAFTYRGRHT